MSVRVAEPVTGAVKAVIQHAAIYPASHYVVEKDKLEKALGEIKDEMDRTYEDFFRQAKARHSDKIGLHLGYSETLAMEIYAGADLFLMPSRSEPCGLSQMIAMRYGAVPIVRETGGLKDTVRAYEAWNGSGNGFSFTRYNAADMEYVVREALALYRDDRAAYLTLQERGMRADFGWGRSAERYREIYQSICGE